MALVGVVGVAVVEVVDVVTVLDRRMPALLIVEVVVFVVAGVRAHTATGMPILSRSQLLR
jgi:hypothetical protein